MRVIYNIDHILSTDKKAQSTVIKTGKWFSDHYPILVV
jgi:endonuclease/exonuclease/phosphatase family metal-dependent hydrolase